MPIAIGKDDAMDFLLVVFDDCPATHIGDVPQGNTGIVLELEAGTHTVTPGPPFDYSPIEQKGRLRNRQRSIRVGSGFNGRRQ